MICYKSFVLSNIFSKQVNEYTSKQERDALLLIFYMIHLCRSLLSFEILMGGNVVERTANALDGYLFHAVLVQNKKSRFFVGSGTELLYGQLLCLARAFPLRFTEQSKSKSRKTVRCVP